MDFKIIRRFTLIVTLLFFSHLQAAEVYHAEIGANTGISYYLGDANNKLFKNPEFTYGLIYRQKFNPRLAIQANWNYTKVSGTGLLYTGTSIDFSNQIHALDFCGEFNFFDLEKKDYKPFSKTYSPFIYAGVGAMLYNYEGKQDFMFSYPFGVGLKKMLGYRLNLNIMWSHRLLLTDQMEGVKQLNDPEKLNGTNLFNYDVLSTLSVGLTIDIFKERCKCMNNHF